LSAFGNTGGKTVCAIRPQINFVIVCEAAPWWVTNVIDCENPFVDICCTFGDIIQVKGTHAGKNQEQTEMTTGPLYVGRHHRQGQNSKSEQSFDGSLLAGST
jgi:hypothetical protein